MGGMRLGEILRRHRERLVEVGSERRDDAAGALASYNEGAGVVSCSLDASVIRWMGRVPQYARPTFSPRETSRNLADAPSVMIAGGTTDTRRAREGTWDP